MGRLVTPVNYLNGDCVVPMGIAGRFGTPCCREATAMGRGQEWAYQLRSSESENRSVEYPCQHDSKRDLLR